MRRSQRLIAASVLVVLSGAVAGCSSGISSWDPMDMLDWIDTKKKLPGDRKPVFPEGVPGLEQGVPKHLYKGASQQEIDRQNAQAAAAAAAPPPAEDAKSKTISQIQEQATRPASTDPAAATPEEDGTAAAPPRAQAQEDRPSAHHRAAGRSAGRCATSPPSRHNNRLRHSRHRCRVGVTFQR